MKRLWVIFTLLFVFSCEDKKDTTPPEVTITAPSSGSTVNEVVNVTCMATDNKEVSKVELWVGGVNTGLTDDTEPYSFQWNTTKYNDGDHTLIVRGYDTSENEGDSPPITIKVDNTISVPNPVNVTEVNYTLTEMTVKWLESTDTDFSKYSLLYSQSESGTKETIETYSDKTTISYATTTFDPTHENWYWVEVADSFGYSIIGSGKTNTIDTAPTESVINSVIYKDGGFTITWTKNNDNDFKSYTLYESQAEDMSNKTIASTFNDNTITTYVVSDIGSGETRYYQLVTEDVFGLKSSSNIYKAVSHILFTTVFGEKDRHQIGKSVKKTTDGGYIVLGDTEEAYEDFLLIKIDSTGNEEWNKIFSEKSRDYGESVLQVSDGGYILLGTSRQDNGKFDIWLIKTDSNGNEEWDKTFGGERNDVGKSIIQTSDGGYAIGGVKDLGPFDGQEDFYLIKTDASGNEEWSKTFGESNVDQLWDIIESSDGGFALVGSNQCVGDCTGNRDVWLIKTDSKGNEEWNRKLDLDNRDDVGLSLKQTADGEYIISGYTNFEHLLIKTKNNGYWDWHNTFGDGNGNSVALTLIGDEGFITVGEKLIRTEHWGNELWSIDLKTIFGTNGANGFSVIQTADGGFVITGGVQGITSNYNDLMIVKTDKNGKFIKYSD